MHAVDGFKYILHLTWCRSIHVVCWSLAMEDESDEDLYITQNVFTSDKVSDSDCQLDLDAVIELAYSGEESESEVRNTVFQKL